MIKVLALTVRPDLDGDCDVDEDDMDLFRQCAWGPAIPHDGGLICMQADFNNDGDMDQDDFAVLQGCRSGANVVSTCGP